MPPAGPCPFWAAGCSPPMTYVIPGTGIAHRVVRIEKIAPHAGQISPPFFPDQEKPPVSGSTLPFPFNSAKGAEAVLGTSYVVASGKGGTGKTSFVAGVGAALARAGHKTLCIDADVGLRNLDLALGMSDRAVMKLCRRHRRALHPGARRGPAPRPVGPLPADGPHGPGTPCPSPARRCAPFCSRPRPASISASSTRPAGLGAGFRLAAAGADRAISRHPPPTPPPCGTPSAR